MLSSILFATSSLAFHPFIFPLLLFATLLKTFTSISIVCLYLFITISFILPHPSFSPLCLLSFFISLYLSFSPLFLSLLLPLSPSPCPSFVFPLFFLKVPVELFISSLVFIVISFAPLLISLSQSIINIRRPTNQHYHLHQKEEFNRIELVDADIAQRKTETETLPVSSLSLPLSSIHPSSPDRSLLTAFCSPSCAFHCILIVFSLLFLTLSLRGIATSSRAIKWISEVMAMCTDSENDYGNCVVKTVLDRALTSEEEEVCRG